MKGVKNRLSPNVQTLLIKERFPVGEVSKTFDRHFIEMVKYTFNMTHIGQKSITVKVTAKTQNKGQKIAQELRKKLLKDPTIWGHLETLEKMLKPGDRQYLDTNDLATMREWTKFNLSRELTVYVTKQEKYVFELY